MIFWCKRVTEKKFFSPVKKFPSSFHYLFNILLGISKFPYNCHCKLLLPWLRLPCGLFLQSGIEQLLSWPVIWTHNIRSCFSVKCWKPHGSKIRNFLKSFSDLHQRHQFKHLPTFKKNFSQKCIYEIWNRWSQSNAIHNFVEKVNI